MKTHDPGSRRLPARWAVCLAACLLAAAAAGAAEPDGPAAAGAGPSFAVAGRVTDDETGEPLAGAVISSSAGGETQTDADGRFFLAGPAPGGLAVEARLPGYLPRRQSVTGQPGAAVELALALHRAPWFSQSIEVTGAREPALEPAETVAPETVVEAPGAREDAFQALKVLPGVVAGDDYSSRLFVRGGRPDQNGIYLDGIPIYDPYRLFGLTSLANPETLAAITLYPGGFDARYGDRLSAVIDIQNRVGTTDEAFRGSANVSLTNTNLVGEGSLGLGFDSSWLASFRRTYYDLLLKEFDENHSSYPSFTDYQLRLLAQPAAAHRWTVTLLGCNEGTDLTADERETGAEVDSHVEADDSQRDYVAGLEGQHLFGTDLRLQYVLSHTRNEQKSAIDYMEGTTGFDSSLSQDLTSSVTSFRPWVEAYLGDHTLMAGGELAASANVVEFEITTEDPRWEIPESLRHFSVDQSTSRYGGFLQDTWALSRAFEVKAGARWDRSTLSGMSATSPRASLAWHPGESWELRAAWGHYYQFPSYDSLQGEGYFLDLRGIRDADLAPEHAEHFMVSGSFAGQQGWKLTLALYAKQLDDLYTSATETRTDLVLDDQGQAYNYTYEIDTFEPVNGRHGYARGGDLTFTLMEGKSRPYYAFLAYTYGEARGHEDGTWRWDARDQRHSLILTGGWKLAPTWEIAGAWHLATGFPYTPVTNILRVVNDLDGDGVYEPDQGEDFTYKRDDPPELVNSERLPPYHRLDLRIEYAPRLRGIDWTFYLDVINVYARNNVEDYSYSEDYSKREEVTGFPFLPSIGVKAKF